jgi:hypothetical protein
MAETCCESEKAKEKINKWHCGWSIVCEEYINATGCLNTILRNVSVEKVLLNKKSNKLKQLAAKWNNN